LAILNENRDLLEAIAQQILDVEVIEGAALHNLLNQVRPPAQKVPVAV
jgi:cell division protease FtsH